MNFPDQSAEEKASFHTVLCDCENEGEESFEFWGYVNHSTTHLKTIMAFYDL